MSGADGMPGADAAGSNPYADSAPDGGERSETHPKSPSGMQNRPRTGGGRSRFRFPTAILLTCAALGVAGGALLAPANWISTILFPGLPFVSVGLAGLWLLPSVIALRLLRRPLVGLLVGLLAGLVIVPFSGYGFSLSLIHI